MEYNWKRDHGAWDLGQQDHHCAIAWCGNHVMLMQVLPSLNSYVIANEAIEEVGGYVTKALQHSRK